MKPRELYSGQAPGAMSQMGAGLLEAGANTANSIRHGYEAMGQGIASGISSMGKAYGDYKSAKTSNDITKLMLDDPQYRQMLGVKSDEDAKAIKDNMKSIIERYGQIGGAQYTSQYLGPLQQHIALGQSYSEKLKQAQAVSPEQAAVLKAQADLYKSQSDAFKRKSPSAGDTSFFSKPFSFLDAPADDQTQVSFGLFGGLPSK